MSNDIIEEIVKDKIYSHGPFIFQIKNEEGMRTTFVSISFAGTDMDEPFTQLSFNYRVQIPKPIPVTNKSTQAQKTAAKKAASKNGFTYVPLSREYIVAEVKRIINDKMSRLFNGEFADVDHSHTIR